MNSTTNKQVLLCVIIVVVVAYVLYKIFTCHDVPLSQPMSGGYVEEAPTTENYEEEKYSDEIIDDNIYGGI